MNQFPYTDKNGQHFFLEITEEKTQLRQLDLALVDEKPAAWGIARIQTRTRELQCQSPMPRVSVGTAKLNHGFRSLRKKLGPACGDICPHRGYDLRTIEPDATGHRQCPLHQLRVKAPRGAPKTAGPGPPDR